MKMIQRNLKGLFIAASISIMTLACSTNSSKKILDTKHFHGNEKRMHEYNDKQRLFYRKNKNNTTNKVSNTKKVDATNDFLLDDSNVLLVNKYSAVFTKLKIMTTNELLFFSVHDIFILLNKIKDLEMSNDKKLDVLQKIQNFYTDDYTFDNDKLIYNNKKNNYVSLSVDIILKIRRITKNVETPNTSEPININEISKQKIIYFLKNYIKNIKKSDISELLETLCKSVSFNFIEKYDLLDFIKNFIRTKSNQDDIDQFNLALVEYIIVGSLSDMTEHLDKLTNNTLQKFLKIFGKEQLAKLLKPLLISYFETKDFLISTKEKKPIISRLVKLFTPEEIIKMCEGTRLKKAYTKEIIKMREGTMLKKTYTNIKPSLISRLVTCVTRYFL